MNKQSDRTTSRRQGKTDDETHHANPESRRPAEGRNTTSLKTLSGGAPSLSQDSELGTTRRQFLRAGAGCVLAAIAGCALFEESRFEMLSIWPSTDIPDQSTPFSVEIRVRNGRSSQVRGEVVLNVDSEPAGRREITLDGGAERTVSLDITIDAIGEHLLSSGDVQTVVRVQRFPPAFISRQGRHLTDECVPVYLSGGNNFLLTDPYLGDKALVDATMRAATDAGFDVLRMWAFCAGQGGLCLQPEPETYDERAFRHLDYVVASAKRYGLKLVPALVNNWGELGGMDQYVAWSSTATRHDDFYVDEECRQFYKSFVEKVVTRTNTITGLEYRDDPTIMMWNLANEPRALSDPSGDITTEWFAEMASFLKSLDSNHLVTTGMEGFDIRDDWWSAEQGTDFVRAHEIDDIDVCSAHLHAGQWNMSGDEAREWIQSRTELAHEEIGKPIYFGEFAFRPGNWKDYDGTDNVLKARDEYFEEWYDTFESADVDVALLWHFIARHDTWAGLDRQGFRWEHIIADRDARTLELAREYADQITERSCR